MGLHKENLIKEMASKPRHPPGPPMTLGNMRELGVQNLVASCLNDACRHVALTDVSSYSADTEVPWFRSRVVSAKCGSRGNKIEVANSKEQPPSEACPARYGAIRPSLLSVRLLAERSYSQRW